MTVREHILTLARKGPGWHAYAIDAAQKLEKDDPAAYSGLVAEVEKVIGQISAIKARQALEWFERNPAKEWKK